MNIGMLWYDDDAKRQLDEKVARAVEFDLDQGVTVGIRVHRPPPTDFTRIYRTQDWAVDGHYAYCPRDTILTVGTRAIEAPMAMRHRQDEARRHADPAPHLDRAAGELPGAGRRDQRRRGSRIRWRGRRPRTAGTGGSCRLRDIAPPRRDQRAECGRILCLVSQNAWFRGCIADEGRRGDACSAYQARQFSH